MAEIEPKIGNTEYYMPDCGYEFYLLGFNLKIKFISTFWHVISFICTPDGPRYQQEILHNNSLNSADRLFSKYQFKLIN